MPVAERRRPEWPAAARMHLRLVVRGTHRAWLTLRTHISSAPFPTCPSPPQTQPNRQSTRSPQHDDMLVEPCPFIPAELENLVGMLDPTTTDSDEPQYAEDFRCPAPCSFLRVGQTFAGQQRAAHQSFAQEQWGVTVRIQVPSYVSRPVC